MRLHPGLQDREEGMDQYEYKVVPAPARGLRQRGARTGAERFAAAVADLMNTLAREGWEYQRADILPCEERAGLTRRVTVYHNLLVFRRATGKHPGTELPPLRLTMDIPAAAPPATDGDAGPAPSLGAAERADQRADEAAGAGRPLPGVTR